MKAGHRPRPMPLSQTQRMHIRRPPISDRRIRFALVGCGRIAQNHFEAIRQHAAQAELVAVCDNDPAVLRDAVGKTQAQGFASLTELLAGSKPDCVVLSTPSGLHPQQAIEVRRRRRRRDDRKADGHALERRPGAWCAPATRPACACSSSSRTAATARLQLLKQAMDEGPLRPHLHGQRQRLLVAAAGLLRQRRLARHLGVRRRRVHEPGQPLRRPARLAGRPGGKRHGLHRHAGAQHRGRGHRRGRAEVAQRRDGLDQRHHAHLAEEPRRLDHHPRREGQRARRRRGGEPDRALAVPGQRPDGPAARRGQLPDHLGLRLRPPAVLRRRDPLAARGQRSPRSMAARA